MRYTWAVPRRSSSQAVRTDIASGKVVTFPTAAKVKNPAAVALGKLGGSKGGKARAERLTPEERTAIARQGGLARQAMARVKNEAEAKASRRGGSS